MAGPLEGKGTLVTGAASGIGRAAAIEFAGAGARVLATDIDDDGGEETVAQIREAGGSAHYLHVDVADPDDVERMVGEAVSRFGRLDGAFNNAGTEGTLTTTVEYPDEIWARVIAINLTGVWLCMKHEIPAMLEHGGGSIVNNASILGLVGFETASAYTASKHGVLGLTKVAALEYAAQGIRVNAVCPAFIETPMVMDRGVAAGSDPEMLEQIVALHPIGRLGRPEEIANLAIWLLSDAASFVTAQAIAADGGFLAR